MAKKGKKEVPAMSTSSLPDIVFMLLFFFMAATTMRDTDPLVNVAMPEAREITELDKKGLVNVWIGQPLQRGEGDALKIQLNDQICEVSDIQDLVHDASAKKSMALSQMTVNLRVDKTATVGKLTDVKQELRRAEAYSISYAAKARVH
ncbi:MAG: biopolymer transporter ExbD [Alistipes sp.]|nr:biopolymer transporter ExbD [Alistipes sp.]MBO7307944.1 biopolymer transporter ExbD [Alistipes sp.]